MPLKQVCELCNGTGRMNVYGDLRRCRDCNGTGLEDDPMDTGWGPQEWRDEAQMRATGPLAQYPLRRN